jgi:hypothetical protein
MRTDHGQKDLLAGPRDERRFRRKREIISGRHADGSQFDIEFGGDESSPEDLGFALWRRRFYIQGQKSMKDVLNQMSTDKMQCEFAQHPPKGPTVGESNTSVAKKT